MAKQLQYRRLALLAVILIAGFAALGYRLVDLQVFRHQELKREAENLTKRTYRLEPRRGDILDIKGNLLATSVFVKTVCADPTLISNRPVEVARAIAPLLNLKEAELAQRLQPRSYTNAEGETLPVRYVVLQRKVSNDVWEKVRTTMEKLPLDVDGKKLTAKEKTFYDNLRKKAVFTDPVDDQLRTYPSHALAAHVLGYVGIAEHTTSSGGVVAETTGMDGIERSLNDKLKGVRGWRVTERNRERELVALREQDVEPQDGLNVVLTIDSVIQHIVESALAEGMEKHSPESICAMVMRPGTGDILAMATLPNFDPNNLRDNLPENRRNRVICDLAEPGSTFKIVVVSGALNDRTVSLTDQFDCENGHFLFAGKVLHDHEPYGVLSVESIITKSSNIGAAKIGIKMGQERLRSYMVDFGFGAPTGIPLPNETRGIVHNLDEWTKLSISRIPMGHEVGVTPLQMMMAMGAVANKGVLMKPRLVDRLVDQEGNVVAKIQPQQVRRVISEGADHDIVEALKTVITSDGTAAKAALEHYTVAGKTGTAQKTDGRVYLDKFFSSFVGFFPADNPEICIYVALDDPKGVHYGGQVAAPIFKQIAEKAANYLNLKPDRTEPQTARGSMGAGTSRQPGRGVAARSP